MDDHEETDEHRTSQGGSVLLEGEDPEYTAVIVLMVVCLLFAALGGFALLV